MAVFPYYSTADDEDEMFDYEGGHMDDRWHDRRTARARPKMSIRKELSDKDFMLLSKLAPERVLALLANRVEVEQGFFNVREWCQENIDSEYYISGTTLYLPNAEARTKLMLALA